MRGLFDWKVLVAVLIALVVAGAALGGTGGVRNLLENGWGKARSLLSGGPLPSLGGSAVPVKVLLQSPVALTPDRPVDVAIGEVRVHGFSGSLTVDRANGTVLLKQGALELSAPLANVTFPEFSIAALSVSGAAFTILPNVSTANGSLELRGFHGSLALSREGALLDGNVTSLRTSIGGREWELK